MIFYFSLLRFVERCKGILTIFIYKKVKKVFAHSSLRYLIVFSFVILQSQYSVTAQCKQRAIKAYGNVSKTIDEAKVYGKNGVYEKQLELCLKAVEQTRKIQDRDSCFWPDAHLALSDVYYNTGNFEKALQSASEALSFCKQFEMDN